METTKRHIILKTSLSHLPQEKQEQLALVKKIILEHIEATEMIILFGSYSTGKWVEDRYVEEGITYEYISDFDILVVTTNAKATRLHWKWDKVNAIIADNPGITRTKIISHSIGFLNEHIRDNYYFFADIFKQGIMLYDSGSYVLASPQPLSSKKRKQKAQDYFEVWLGKATSSLKGFNFYLKEQEYNWAAFLLHQATECYYTTFLLVFTDYRPKLHDIQELGDQASQIKREMRTVFPRATEEEKRLFTLLQKAYTGARYKKDYVITKEELTYLSERVKVLGALVERLCKAQIEAF